MIRLKRELPPPNSLVVFEAAARHLNYTQAALELGVTQAAVSRQMRTLEEFVGCPLFVKKARRLVLTEEGSRLQEDVTQGLGRIAETVQRIRSNDLARKITITTTPAVALLWLTPRLKQFRETHSGIDVSLIATDWILDQKTEGIDVAIRYGTGNWPDGNSTFLFSEEIFPVCSPEYLKQHPISQLSDLKTVDLIHFETLTANKAKWRDWFVHVGAGDISCDTGMRFNNYQAMLNAALDGQGVALGCSNLIDTYLSQQKLVKPLSEEMKTTNGFWIFIADDVTTTPEIEIFTSWLKTVAGD